MLVCVRERGREIVEREKERERIHKVTMMVSLSIPPFKGDNDLLEYLHVSVTEDGAA